MPSGDTLKELGGYLVIAIGVVWGAILAIRETWETVDFAQQKWTELAPPTARWRFVAAAMLRAALRSSWGPSILIVVAVYLSVLHRDNASDRHAMIHAPATAIAEQPTALQVREAPPQPIAMQLPPCVYPTPPPIKSPYEMLSDYATKWKILHSFRNDSKGVKCHAVLVSNDDGGQTEFSRQVTSELRDVLDTGGWLEGVKKADKYHRSLDNGVVVYSSDEGDAKKCAAWFSNVLRSQPFIPAPSLPYDSPQLRDCPDPCFEVAVGLHPTW